MCSSMPIERFLINDSSWTGGMDWGEQEHTDTAPFGLDK